MSLINKVLRDLDRRHAISTGDATVPPAQVRAVEPRSDGHEWFWRVVAVLTLAALTWVSWVIYQVRPRPLATELALQAAEEARARPKPVRPVQVVEVAPKPPVVPAESAPPAAEQAKPPAEPVAQAVTAPKPAPAPELLRLASSIETPIVEPARKSPEKAPAVAAEKPAARVATPKPPAAKTAKAPLFLAGKSRVERRDRALSPSESADTEFRRAVELLKRGRGAEAEQAFAAALEFDPRHRGARQALVALNFERGQLENARRLLQDGLAADPAQPDFAVALARIYIERGNLQAALAAMQGSEAAAANHAEYHVLRGTILQRLGRHAEAADAYRTALNVQSSMPHAWMGLGISLEALQQRAEAAQAFRQALAAGPVSAELKTFAEQRIRALR
ncbi:MAG TPA: tetratricopeptide repeat protein [Burkholderiales bacterium]|nr:tetratricopeptide repeat protein [Burkholderiales bacterium]